MKNKKTKLTISGTAKKSIKNIEIARTQGKKSVLIDKSKKNLYLDLLESNKKYISENKVSSEIIENQNYFTKLVNSL